MDDTLLKIENKLRSSLEDVQSYQWIILYHQNSTSFIFRRSNQEKFNLEHSQYPSFFETLFSIKKEMNGTANKFHLDNLKTTFFGVLPQNPNLEFIALPIYNEQTNSSIPLATILAVVKNPTNLKLKTTDKKKLFRASQLLGETLILEEKINQLKIEEDFLKDFHFQSFKAPSHIEQCLKTIQDRIGAENYMFFGINKKNIELIFSSKEIEPTKHAEKKISFDKLLANISAPKQKGVLLVLGKAINNTLPKKDSFYQESSLNLFLETPHQYPFSKVILQFSSSKKQFNNIDYLYLKRASQLLQNDIINQKFFLNLKNFNKIGSTHGFNANQMTCYRQGSIEILLNHSILQENSIVNTSFSKSTKPLKATNQAGKIDKVGQFVYWGMKDDLSMEKKYSMTKASHFFFNYYPHLDDFEKNISEFLRVTNDENDLKKSILIETDESHSQVISNIKVKSKNFQFLHYSFEIGKIKKVNCETKHIFRIREKDFLIGLPTQKTIPQSLCDEIENIIILQGYLGNNKLTEAFNSLFNQHSHQEEYLIIKKAEQPTSTTTINTKNILKQKSNRTAVKV